MTDPRSTCPCGRAAEHHLRGWPWCLDCYQDFCCLRDGMSLANPPRIGGTPLEPMRLRTHPDSAEHHDKLYHGGTGGL